MTSIDFLDDPIPAPPRNPPPLPPDVRWIAAPIRATDAPWPDSPPAAETSTGGHGGAGGARRRAK